MSDFDATAVGIEAVQHAIALVTASGDQQATQAALRTAMAAEQPAATMQALAMFADLLLDVIVGAGGPGAADKQQIMQAFALQVAEHGRRGDATT